MKQTVQPKTADRMKPLHGLYFIKAFLNFSLANSEQRNTVLRDPPLIGQYQTFWKLRQTLETFSQYRGEILVLAQCGTQSYIAF